MYKFTQLIALIKRNLSSIYTAAWSFPSRACRLKSETNVMSRDILPLGASDRRERQVFHQRATMQKIIVILNSAADFAKRGGRWFVQWHSICRDYLGSQTTPRTFFRRTFSGYALFGFATKGWLTSDEMRVKVFCRKCELLSCSLQIAVIKL